MLDKFRVKIWLDDERLAPIGYIQCHSVNEVRAIVEKCEKYGVGKFFLDLDHDLGEYSKEGGEGRQVIIWLIETNRNNSNYQVKVHSANVPASEWMNGMVKRYWK